MGYTTSAVHGIEVPDSAEANNVPEDIGKVVTALEGGSFARRLTGAQIAALTAPQKPAGLVVYNTTTNKLQISDGTNFADVGAPVYAIGVRSGSSQTIAHNTWTTLTHTSETDPSSILSGGSVTIPSAGLWLVGGSATFQNSAGFSDRWSLQLQLNGSEVSGIGPLFESDNSYSTQHEGSQTALIVASASDVVRMQAWHFNTSSGTRDISAARLFAAKIGL